MSSQVSQVEYQQVECVVRAVVLVRGAAWVLTITLASCGGPRAPHAVGGCHSTEDGRVITVFSSRPVVSIGGFTDDVDGVVAAELLRDNQILVANAGTDEVRMYDERGGLLWSAGGRGGGPSEFRSLSWVGMLSPDSALAFDSGNQRFTVFDMQGVFVRSFQLNLPVPAPFARPVGMIGERSLLVAESAYPRPQQQSNEIVRDSSALFVLGIDGTTNRYGTFPMRSVYALDRFVTAAPLWPDGHIAVSDSGFYFGFADAMFVQFFATVGGRRDVFRPEVWRRREVSEAMRAVVTRQALRAAPGDFRQQMREVYASMPFPPTLPAFSDLVVDGRNRLWIEEYPLPGQDESCWLVVDDTEVSAKVRLPADLRVYDIKDNLILGILRDKWDVEHIQVHVLEGN